ncbi:MAG: acetate--CoA ligase alpha subunit [Candidatus Humimicrobiaceae bacterium]
MSLEKFFCPESVAIIGAGREEGKVGHTILEGVMNSKFKGRIYPVNPKAEEIHGLKCLKSIFDAPEDIDLAIIVIPGKYVLVAINECAKKNVKAAIVISAGFKETGPIGAELEKELLEKARQYNMRILGPNCLGMSNTTCPVNASFSPEMPDDGVIAFISQSGALGTAVLDWAKLGKIGISKFVSLGNKVDISETDIFEYLEDDDSCKVITAYIEGISEGQRFIDVSKKVTKKKPIVVVKAGNTSAGAKAVSSHTGSLSGSAKAYEAAFKQAGIIRARTIRNLLDYSTSLAYQPLPKGRNLVIITNAGGPGIMATDVCEENNITMPALEKETIDKLKEFLPEAANFNNPVDVLGDALADRYKKALEIIIKDKNVDAIIILLTPQAMTQAYETAVGIVEVMQNSPGKIPILACFMGGKAVKEGIDYLIEHRIPNFDIPEGAVSATRVMMNYYEWLVKKEEKGKTFEADKKAVKEIFDSIREKKRFELGENESRKVLEAYKIRVPQAITARNIAEAKAFTKKVGYPVVLKIDSPDILHKTDVGGIKVGIRNDLELETGFNDIISSVKDKKPEANIRGISIQEMIMDKQETIIGINKDPQFGPMIMFGLGGIYVEILKDVSFRIAPIIESDAREMIEEIKAVKLLKGARGAKPSDINSIVEILLKISQLVTDFPEIMEMDINPLFVKAEGLGSIAGDVRIRIKE